MNKPELSGERLRFGRSSWGFQLPSRLRPYEYPRDVFLPSHGGTEAGSSTSIALRIRHWSCTSVSTVSVSRDLRRSVKISSRTQPGRRKLALTMSRESELVGSHSAASMHIWHTRWLEPARFNLKIALGSCWQDHWQTLISWTTTHCMDSSHLSVSLTPKYLPQNIACFVSGFW